MRDTEFFGNTYTIPDGYIGIKTRAVKAEVNWNYDCFTEDEMAKAAHTYDDCDLVYFDHTYTKTADVRQYEDGIDRSRSRGFIVAQHYEDGVQYCLMAVSKEWPKLVDAILDGRVNAVSMGCDCTTYCSICDTEFDNMHSCECGACPNMIGSRIHGKLVYDVLRDIQYYELSIVPDPACASALFYEVIA